MNNTTVIKYLIDTNSLITPYKTYYPFDFAGKFWDQLNHAICNGDIIVLDLVFEEVKKGDDQLSEWINEVDSSLILNHIQPAIITRYAEILQHIQMSNFYKEKALLDWSKTDAADPWLIATACTYGYRIITFETKNGNLNMVNKSARAKIPDVCSVFGVACEDLYSMMRNLSFNM
ncbi:MAG TPA: DUF4411 family protein [Mobilitalea sp.]|nr:DUF4411 family protein [Mobilitalea sp.]